MVVFVMMAPQKIDVFAMVRSMIILQFRHCFPDFGPFCLRKGVISFRVESRSSTAFDIILLLESFKPFEYFEPFKSFKPF